MSIPETQLKSWSKQGSTVGSATTYKSIQSALAQHNWPRNMGSPDVYLQGSYRSHTNIRGDSDVDVVAECSRLVCSNHSSAQSGHAGLFGKAPAWKEFSDEIFTALVAYYDGTTLVRHGKKCISVNGTGQRLNADIVACCQYKRFHAGIGPPAEGITFWTRSGEQVINYPKLHHDNGAKKNASCNDSFKPLIRVFKNARNRAGSDFPSYFLECLLYNVPDSQYTGTLSQMFHNVLLSLEKAAHNGTMCDWWCQNKQQQIFGNAIHQTQIAAARSCLDNLEELCTNG